MTTSYQTQPPTTPQEMAASWLDKAVEASRNGEHDRAEQAFLAALSFDPALAEAHLGLGLTYMATRRFPQAVAPLRLAVASPDAPTPWLTCLAQALYMTGDFADSAETFGQADRLEPLAENARTTWAETRCLADLISGPTERAFARYQATTGAEDERMVAFAEETSAVLGVFGHPIAAAAAGRWRLARTPGDLVTAYRLSALDGAALDRAPADYVEAHFDAFADRFDHQLVEMLNYSAPADLAALLRPHQARFGEAVDLGCGTGLALEVLAPLANAVTGVDLSGGMLAQAAQRGGYSSLIKAEAVTFLVAHPVAFDLVFAADVLIYFGDLAPVFEAAAGALRPGGLFALSTEHGKADWTLLSSGRFSHANAYIDRLVPPAFRLEARAPTHLRQEGSVRVEGSLHVLVRL